MDGSWMCHHFVEWVVSWHPFETSEATFDEAIQETLQTDPAVCRLGGPHAAGAIGAVFKMVDRMGPAALAVCGFCCTESIWETAELIWSLNRSPWEKLLFDALHLCWPRWQELPLLWGGHEAGLPHEESKASGNSDQRLCAASLQNWFEKEIIFPCSS